ncbi:hypothetical protein [Cryptosporangium sp. NPDC048952]|uniref:hypothetical protein n=1 Tax=Cryptosporangium sp. NPDC048952 TaxID=3363961 RepID=UPI003718C2A2
MMMLRAASRILVVAALLGVAACGGEDPEEPPPAVPRVAFADGSAVHVRASDGTTKRVAALPGGWQAEALTWSGDGTELAWVASNPNDLSQARIYRAAATGSSVQHWDCALFCGQVRFLGADLVGESSINGPATYPASGGEPDAFVPDGLPGAADLVGLSYRSLLTGSPTGDALYFVTGESTSAPKAIYRVDPSPKATSVQPAGPTGLPLNGTVSPDGSQLAYSVSGAAPGCNVTESVVVIDLRSGKATTLVPPSSTAAMFVAGLWFGAGGRVFAAYVPGPVPCAPGTAEPPDTPTRATTATVYERTGTSWKAVGSQAQDGAELGDGRRLEFAGPLTVGPSRIQQSSRGTLQLIGDGEPQVISKTVTTFAVAPR